MKKKTNPHLLLFSSLAALMACARAPSGSCQQAFSGSVDPVSEGPITTLGGYLDLKIRGKGAQRCTVQVTPHRTQESGVWNLDLTFSRHCYSDKPGSIDGSTLHLYNGEKFEGNLPVTLSLVDRKLKAEQALQDLGVPTDAIEKSIDLFFSMQTYQNNMCTPDENARTMERKPERFQESGQQVLCFGFNDFAHMTATLHSKDLQNKEQQAAVDKLLAQFDQPSEIEADALSESARAAHQFAQMQRTRAQTALEQGHVAFVDFAVIGCQEDVPDDEIIAAAAPPDNAPNQIANLNKLLRNLRRQKVEEIAALEPYLCPYKEQVVRALRPLLKIQNRDPIDRMNELGFNDPRDKDPGTLLSNDATPVDGVYTKIGDLWAHFGDSLPTSATLTFHHRTANSQSSFTHAWPQGATAEPMTPSRFMIKVPATGPGFEKTDSGVILMLAGVFPVAVLSSVDGELVSGGASVVPLDFEKHEVVAEQTRYPAETTPDLPRTDATVQPRTRTEPAAVARPLEAIVGQPPQQSTGQAPLAPPSTRPSPAEDTAYYEPDVPLNTGAGGDPYSVESAQIDDRRRTPRLPEEGSCY